MSTISELFYEVLDAVVPNRTKRLIAITSLCPVITPKENLTGEYLTLLNAQLSLCREEDALKLPIAVSHSIWKKISDEIKLAGNDPDLAAVRIMAGLPEWLKYDKDNVILGEIQSVLRFNTLYSSMHQNEQAQQNELTHSH